MDNLRMQYKATMLSTVKENRKRLRLAARVEQKQERELAKQKAKGEKEKAKEGKRLAKKQKV